MPVKINGATSGSVTLAAPATGSDVTLTLPGSTGTLPVSSDIGLVKITDQTFSAASSVSINNCFTSTYANYRIVCTVASASGIIGVRLRLRVGGVDADGANTYRNKQIYLTGNATVNGDYALNTSAVITECDTDGGGGSMDIFRPNNAVYTFMTGTYDRNVAAVFNNHTHLVATAYDGFTIFPPSSTITGTVRVYGYRN